MSRWREWLFARAHGIATTFRLRAKELARTLPLIPSEPPPDETAP